jgi:hypothetical protein
MEFKKLKIKRVKQSTASERKMKKSEMKAAGQQGGNKTTATDHLATQLMYEYRALAAPDRPSKIALILMMWCIFYLRVRVHFAGWAPFPPLVGLLGLSLI